MSYLPLIDKSRWRRQSHIKQAVRKNVPEYGAKHEQGVDAEEDPKQGLLVESLLVVLQDHHTQCQTDHHPSQVSHKAGVGAGREGRRVEPQPHCPTKLYTHCEQRGEREKHISQLQAHILCSSCSQVAHKPK